MIKPAFEVRCFKKDHLSSRRKRGNLTGTHWIWRRVWMRITCFESQRNSQARQEDEVATKCSSRWSRWDWQLTAAFLVGFHLDIVVSSACRVNWPSFQYRYEVTINVLLFLQLQRWRYCWTKYFASPDSFLLETGSEKTISFWLEVILTGSILESEFRIRKGPII